MLTGQPLPEHERVLRADRDDEREAEAQAAQGDEEGASHAGIVGLAALAVQFMFLQLH